MEGDFIVMHQYASKFCDFGSALVDLCPDWLICTQNRIYSAESTLLLFCPLVAENFLGIRDSHSVITSSNLRNCKKFIHKLVKL